MDLHKEFMSQYMHLRMAYEDMLPVSLDCMHDVWCIDFLVNINYTWNSPNGMCALRRDARGSD